MKKFFALISALLLTLVCVCVPVGAHTLDKESISYTSGTKKKFKMPDGSKSYKIVLSQKGNLSIKWTCESYYITLRLYDIDGELVKINGSEYYYSFSNKAGIASIDLKDISLKKGTYYVQLKCNTGYSCESTITMKYPSNDDNSSSSKASLPAISLKKGSKVALAALVSGKATDDVSLTTSDKKIAKVDSDGVVTAVSNGTAIITINSGKKSFQIAVIVK